MLSELMYIFTPQSGLVLDRFSGTMTTEIATLLTGRPCIVFDKDKGVHKAAIRLLRKLVPEKGDLKLISIRN